MKTTPAWIKTVLVLSIIFNILAVVYKVVKANEPVYEKIDLNNIQYSFKRDQLYKLLPINNTDNVFIGDSQIQKFDLAELLEKSNLKNRGIDGDVAAGVYKRLGSVIQGKPAKIFVEIGVNDLLHKVPVDSSFYYTSKIINDIGKNSPQTKLYINSLLPCSILDSAVIIDYNKRLKKLCDLNKITYIDIYAKLSKNGKLNPQYDCGDGLHLSGDGYLVWSGLLKTYID